MLIVILLGFMCTMQYISVYASSDLQFLCLFVFLPRGYGVHICTFKVLYIEIVYGGVK